MSTLFIRGLTRNVGYLDRTKGNKDKQHIIDRAIRSKLTCRMIYIYLFHIY